MRDKAAFGLMHPHRANEIFCDRFADVAVSQRMEHRIPQPQVHVRNAVRRGPDGCEFRLRRIQLCFHDRCALAVKLCIGEIIRHGKAAVKLLLARFLCIEVHGQTSLDQLQHLLPGMAERKGKTAVFPSEGSDVAVLRILNFDFPHRLRAAAALCKNNGIRAPLRVTDHQMPVGIQDAVFLMRQRAKADVIACYRVKFRAVIFYIDKCKFPLCVRVKSDADPVAAQCSHKVITGIRRSIQRRKRKDLPLSPFFWQNHIGYPPLTPQKI